MPILGPSVSASKQKRSTADLLRALKSKDIRTRREAIQALGEGGDPEAIPALVAVLTSELSRVSEQIDAAEALGKIADPAALDALLQASAASIEREHAAVEEANSVRGKKFRRGFYVNRISADEYTLRRIIAEAIGRIGGTRAVVALFDMLAMEKGWMESSVRDAIRRVIAQMLRSDDASHAQILLERLRHNSKEVRHCSAYCLREFRGPGLANALMDVAWDDKEDYAVRDSAIGSLGKIGDVQALPDLEELARGPNRAIARLAAHSALEIRQRNGMSLTEAN